jgi:polar amino acid transport system substrate-binding protein
MTQRKYLSVVAVFAAMLLSTATGSFAQSTCDGAETVNPGVLYVAFNGDMPGTSLRDGQLAGIDGEIMMAVAERLGIPVEPQLMEWAAEIESVKSGRVDAMHGMMGWNAARTEVIAMSDPIYFAGALMTQRSGEGITSMDQLPGLRLGTGQGFGWVPELQRIDPDLRLYDTSDAAVRDLVAGRVDVLFLDPPLIQFLATQQPDLPIESIPVTDPYDPEFPDTTGKYQVVFGLSLDAPNLMRCVNDAIAEIWASCTNYEIASSYGFSDRYWFTPPTENPRAGADRPADWAYPQLGSCN